MTGERLLIFDVDGGPDEEPVPQGSLTPFYQRDRKTGKPIWTRDGRLILGLKASNEKALKKWRKRVGEEALAARVAAGLPILDRKVSLAVEAHFFMERPAGEWGTGRNARHLKEHARAAPVVLPDVDKLLRAILDSLTGVVYADDGMVTRAVAEKHYAVPNGTAAQGIGVTVLVIRREAQTALDLPADQRVRWVPDEQPAEQERLVLAP